MLIRVGNTAWNTTLTPADHSLKLDIPNGGEELVSAVSLGRVTVQHAAHVHAHRARSLAESLHTVHPFQSLVVPSDSAANSHGLITLNPPPSKKKSLQVQQSTYGP
jgi:hypothetical protein